MNRDFSKEDYQLSTNTQKNPQKYQLFGKIQFKTTVRSSLPPTKIAERTRRNRQSRQVAAGSNMLVKVLESNDVLGNIKDLTIMEGSFYIPQKR